MASQHSPGAHEDSMTLNGTEQELLKDVFRALRGLRYGSVVLTVHEGKLVEIQKTERIRAAATKFGS